MADPALAVVTGSTVAEAQAREKEVRELAAMRGELERMKAANDSEEGSLQAAGKISGSVVPEARSKSGDYGTATKAMTQSLSLVMFASKWKGLNKKAAAKRKARREQIQAGGHTQPVAVPMRLKTPPRTPETVCRHPTRADEHMRGPVSRVAVADSRSSDKPVSPPRVHSSMSWDAATQGDGAVALRASRSDLNWLEAGPLGKAAAVHGQLHPRQGGGVVKAKTPERLHGGGSGATPFWLQAQPTLSSGAEQRKAARAKRPASEVRWGRCNTLSNQHRLTEERLLVARYVDDIRRRQALGWRAPVHDADTGQLAWRTSTPDPAKQRGAPQTRDKRARRMRHRGRRNEDGELRPPRTPLTNTQQAERAASLDLSDLSVASLGTAASPGLGVTLDPGMAQAAADLAHM